MTVKVPLYGSPMRAVQLDERATEGARIGINLLMPDGSLGTVAKLQALLGTTPGQGGTSTISTTDDLEEGQWNLYFTKRRAQDAVGGILADSANVTLRYVGGESITADLTDLADTGAGALLAFTRDGKGRVTGTRAATITGTAGRVTVAHGDASDGLPTIDLAAVPDAGGGTLQRTAFDAWGRKTGASAADTDDLAEGAGNLYYTDARVDARIAVAKADPDGIASLVDGKLDPGQLPALAITETFVVDDEASMLALVAEQGDVAVRTDLSKSFILTADPASTLSNWQELLVPTAGVTSFNGRTGSVTPASGDYTFSQIGGKPTTLAGYGITDAATSAQGDKADSAVQPGDLATVATSGSYDDLDDKPAIPAAQVNADWNAASGVAQILNKPALGSAAAADVGDFDPAGAAAAAQAAAESHTDAALTSYTPTSGLGSAAFQPSTTFATAAQGAKADSAVQPAALGPYAKTADLGTAAAHDATDFDPAGAAADAQAAAEAYTDAAVAQPTPRAVVASAETFLTAAGGETGAPLMIDGFPLEGVPTVSAIHRTDWQGQKLLYTTPRTNAAPYSVTPGGSGWSFITAVADSTTTDAPDGSARAARIRGTGNTASRTQHTSPFTISANSMYEVFAHLRYVDSVQTSISLYNGAVTSSLGRMNVFWNGGATPTFTLTNGATGGELTLVEDGYYRAKFTSADTGANTTAKFLVYPDPTSGTHSADVFGVQVEPGQAGSYIETVAPTTVTDYTLSGSSVDFGQAAGVGAVYDWDGSGVPKYPASFAGPVRVGTYTLSTLPSAAAFPEYLITVSDATGGKALCLSDGTDWIDIHTNAAVA